MQNKNLRLEYRDPKTLTPNDRNWRTHSPQQANALKDVIDEVGWAGALLYNEQTGRLCDGHLRRSVADGEKVPVLIGSWTEEQEKLILSTLDPIAAMAGTDQAKLDELLAEMAPQTEAIQALFDGMSKPEFDIEEHDAPEPPDDATTKPGDMWILGEHRLLCGDAADSETVRRLMGNDKATCILTDPPYGVSIGAKNRFLNSLQPAERNVLDIESDSLSPDDLKAMLLPVFANVKKLVMSDDCTLLVTAPQGGDLLTMMQMLDEAGLRARHVLIWKKNIPAFSMGRLDYDYQHEPILLTWGKKHKNPMQGEHDKSVWEIDRQQKCADHPTMKPVALYANAYLNHTDKGDVVADLFAGSGTCFIAAEQTGRRCRGIEISPHCCDVIVSRWEQATGKNARLSKTS